MSETIRVISHLEETLRGRYDGVDYVFETDEPVDMPLEAATHIFDLGKEDKKQAFNQLGWLNPQTQRTYADAIKLYDRITFQVGRTVFDDTDGDAIADESDQPAKKSRSRTGGRPHVAGPGGEQPAAGQSAAGANPA